MKRFCNQSDDSWKDVSRYHKQSSNALRKLDTAINTCLNKKDKTEERMKKDQDEVWRRYGELTRGVNDLIEQGMSGYEIEEYGCWDCTISMIIDSLGGRLYKKGVHYKNPPLPDPMKLIESLKSWKIMSNIGYSDDIYLDSISIITKGEVQLYLHEDYGGDGAVLKDAFILRHALKHKHLVGIALCLSGHAIFNNKLENNKDYSHWVYVDPTKSTENNIMIYDPSDEYDPSEKPDRHSSTSINQDDYKDEDGNVRFYEVCVYSTPKNIKEILKC